MKFRSFVFFMCATFAVHPVIAATVIDQDAFVTPPSGMPLFGWVGAITGSRTQPGAFTSTRYILGQTATAGLSGTLKTIELQYSPTITGLQLRLYDGDALAGGGVFSGNPFSATRVDLNSVSFDVSVFGYFVRPGQRFSFDLLYEMGPNATAFIATGTYEGATPAAPPLVTKYVDYSGGTSFSFINGLPVVTSRDIAFRTSVDVLSSAVPEPTTWVMMLVGFGMVGASIRRLPSRIITA